MKLVLPKSKVVRKCLSKIAAQSNRMVINGGQPISGIVTLCGKAELQPRNGEFRIKIAHMIRRRKKLLES